MKKQKKMPIDFNPAHPEKRLITRRDFLSAGVIGFSGTVMLPSLLEVMLLKQARAAGAGQPIPFIIFDCAGGASLPGNWMPLATGGGPLNSYSTLGLGDTSQYYPDYSFGAGMAAPIMAVSTDLEGNITAKVNSTVSSQIFSSLVNSAGANLPNGNALGLSSSILGGSPQYNSSKLYPNTLLQMGVIPINSMSDSQSNTLSPISLVSATGLTGQYVPVGLGMTAAESGGNSDWGSGNPAYQPLQIQSVTALNDALSYGAALDSLPSSARTVIANTLSSLSSHQAAKFASMNLGQQFNQLMQSAFGKNIANVNGVTGIDPRSDTDVQAVFPVSGGSLGTVGNSMISSSSSPSDPNVVMATLLLNAIVGNSGPVVITMGGCDYHGNPQAVGDAKDAAIGNCIAWAMNLAMRKKQKVAFAVYTDGGIYTQDTDRNWTGDDNGHGLGVFGVMDPSGQPQMAQVQAGGYSQAQICDPSFTVGNDPLKVCHALFLNYLSVIGQVGNYSSIIAAQDPQNTTLLSDVYGGSLSAAANALLLFG